MKKIWICLFAFISVCLSAQENNGYYIGDGGRGQSILIYESRMEGSKNDSEFVTSMIKKDVISNLSLYSALNVIDKDQQEIVKKLQRESENIEYDDSDPIEIGKLIQAKKYVTLTTAFISGKYRISFEIFDIETGSAAGGYNSKNLYDQKDDYILKAPREATAEILSQLGIKLSPSGKRSLLPEIEGKGDIKQALNDSQENLASIKEELDKTYEQLKKTTATQIADQQARNQKARLELKEKMLIEQQKREQSKIARLEEDALRQQQEEEKDQARTEEQRATIKKFGQEVEAKVAQIHKQRSQNMSALQKITVIESEKQLLIDNWTDIENGSADSMVKLEEECKQAQEKRKSQKPRPSEVNPDGTLSELAQQLLETDLEIIRDKYENLQKANKENEARLKLSQDTLKKRITTDINNLVKNSYIADTLANDGLFLRMGDYDVNKLGWKFTLTYTMNDQTIFTSEDFFTYKEITGNEVPQIPGKNDKKYRQKVTQYYDFLDIVESIDSFFRMNVPYIQSKIEYDVIDLSSISPSVYGISVKELQFINIQTGKVFKKQKILKENIFINNPTLTLKPVDDTVKQRVSGSESKEIEKWLGKDDIGEHLKKNARLAGLSSDNEAVTKYAQQKALVTVSGGNFVMGDPDYYSKKIYVNGFKMSATEVTQKLYQVITGENPSEHKGDSLPVENISLKDAASFCNKLSLSSKLTPCYSVNGETDPSKWDLRFYDIKCDFNATGYRLPTETEWEYAARGGRKLEKFKYSGSDNLDEVAWYSENSKETNEVGSKKPNALGLYDMSGNVAELCVNEDMETEIRGGSGVEGGRKEIRRRDWYGDYYKDYEYVNSKNSASDCKVWTKSSFSKGNFTGFRYVCRLSDKQLAKEKAEEKKRIDDFLSKSLSLVKINGGSFMMGNENEDAQSDEKPAHKVTLDSFYMSSTEITQEVYKFITEKNLETPYGDLLPVDRVSWGEAVIFCNLLSTALGRKPCYSYEGETDTKKWNTNSWEFSWDKIECDFSADGYRLPTEAEWEYAARGGKKQQKFSYSGSDNLDEVGWYEGNADKIQNVAAKKPNTLGLYDMSGNVMEWCWDLYGSNYYENSPEKNPKGVEKGRQRVTRGGNLYSGKNGWYERTPSEKRCTVWYRGCTDASQTALGFRVVRSDK
ncbi:MAG: SUMF1/EgtB/PvdO family nonheme iron enzyme [Treponema sp.]|nr:SUMF1/EgtB/PvdO family nonheme iron enzyme [Treponema sp.]